jgi:GDP-L-fucose synthase
MLNILITGASGFVGRSLTHQLQAEGHSVRGLASAECDLTHDGALDALDALARDRYDRIYHLAAWTRAGDFCRRRAGEQWVVNQRINTNVLDWWMRTQPQAKMIAFGTSVSYTRHHDLVEEAYMEGDPSPDYYAYAMSKRMLLAGLRSMHKQFDMQYLYLVPSTVYGPGYATDGRTLHFIYDLIRKILRGKLYGEPVTLWGDGTTRRELIYIDDFITLMQRLIDRTSNEIVNLASGDDHSIAEFAHAICAHVGYDSSRIRYDVASHVGVQAKVLSVDRLRALVPEATWTDLRAGIAATTAWMLEHREIFLPPPSP